MRGIIASLLNPRTDTGFANYPPDHDYWYTQRGMVTASGQLLTPDTARKLSAVWRCMDIIAGSVASLPLNVYRRLPDGVSKEIAVRHPMQVTLHLQANPWMTSYELRELLTDHALLRGNGYAQIAPVLDPNRPDGTFRPFDLFPLLPDRMKVEQERGGRLRYTYTQRDGRKVDVPEEEIFHLRGPSDDGITGMDVFTYARESLGLALAQERFGGSFFSQSPQPSGALKHPGRLSDQAHKRLKASWETAYSGANAHKVALLEEGLDFHQFQVGLTAEQSQMIESRAFQVADIGRWFGVPNHMLGETTGETSWGSGIEQLSIGFVVYGLWHWLKRWEQGISRDLLTAPMTYFAEFTLDALLRGDTKTRHEAYGKALNDGWLTVNEVRALENRNPMPGGDTLRSPLNMAPAGAAGSEDDGGDETADPAADRAGGARGADRRNGYHAGAVPGH